MMKPSKIQLYENAIYRRYTEDDKLADACNTYNTKSTALQHRMAKKAKLAGNTRYFFMFGEDGKRLKRFKLDRFV